MKEIDTPSEMKFEVLSFPNGSMIPGEYALCIRSDEDHVANGGNKNPHLEWSNIPEDTGSLAVLVIDPDAPSVADDVNQEGKSVPSDLQRVDFYHWILVDIPPDIREIPEGADSSGIPRVGSLWGRLITVFGGRTISLIGLREMRRWRASTVGMTVPVHPGTMRSCITTTFACMRWTRRRWGYPENSGEMMRWKQWTDTSWRWLSGLGFSR